MSQARDIIDAISHRLPDRVNIYPTLNRAVKVVAKRLKYHDSSWVKGDLSVSITADTSSGSLPSDFWGLMGEPYVSGYTYQLKPLPDLSTKLINGTNSIPKFYEIMGLTLNLIPGSTSAITIKGRYWKKPTAITKPSDTMPYNEMFDETIQEALLHVQKTGGSSMDANYISMMENFINKSIDEIMTGLEGKIPIKIPNAQRFNSMRWD